MSLAKVWSGAALAFVSGVVKSYKSKLACSDDSIYIYKVAIKEFK